MRYDRLDLNLLVALNALIETRSVSAAARVLNLSQPAVTGALNRLRDFFQDELLVLHGRRMLLTPKAEELADPVRRALAQIRNEITRPGGFDPASTQRRFNIVASDYSYTILIADIIAEAERTAPGLSFELMPPNHEALERMQSAEIDLFMTVGTLTIAHHPHLQLWRDEDVIISWRDAGYDTIDEETYYSASHAVTTFDTGLRSLTDAYVDQLGRERKVSVFVSNFSALPQAVIGTRRLAVMHRLYAQHFARHYPIKLHETWAPFPEVVETAQWHRLRDADPGVRWLIGRVRHHVERLPASSLLPLG